MLLGIEIKTSDEDVYKDVKKIRSTFDGMKRKYPTPNLKTPWQIAHVSKD